jgi:hypothetical protein
MILPLQDLVNPEVLGTAAQQSDNESIPTDVSLSDNFDDPVPSELNILGQLLREIHQSKSTAYVDVHAGEAIPKKHTTCKHYCPSLMEPMQSNILLVLK